MNYDVITHQLTVYTLRFSGRIDATGAQRLKPELRAMTREGKVNFIIDLQDVDFIDSSGLGVMTSLLRAARSAGGDVRLVIKPNSSVPKILALVRFDMVFDLHTSHDEALDGFRLLRRSHEHHG